VDSNHYLRTLARTKPKRLGDLPQGSGRHHWPSPLVLQNTHPRDTASLLESVSYHSNYENVSEWTKLDESVRSRPRP